MRSAVAILFLIETCLYAIASLTHAGLILEDHEHRQAMIAEAVISAVLLLGLISLGLDRSWSRMTAILAQSFALLGTLVGAFTIAVGVGPQTTLDYITHAVMILLLVTGLVWLARSRSGASSLR
ncbi:hypothetical protein ELI24_14100 [Rhizobium ruizarguesonis]|jgi:hypothetical protein|uniref:hypothetical protein n=1 Tax=Rhizobium ruizarguesonis TaxID=2081791 RepID=UPI00036E277E|nr:hypothetical protein [Rhizobium ruizarguesonis]MBY5828978.1 hypothetical protein [Rhizobium leguminosarum]QJS28247.1 hypothetical protein RLTA1_13520 [Rhizobium leguminosarum bv. trifolii TA1]MBY5853582.1 hypothetical protein [Rhizobium leguminosarum]MBY5857644.1 hypothetical protein [Rhizobium leguminosarum]MBY5870429.1 hypothetical protein [Rhizobium leguminosarum]